MILRVDIDQFAATLAMLGDKWVQAASKGLRSGALRGRHIVVEETDAKGAVNTGYYKRAWKAERVDAETARIWNDAPYAGVIEYGRRPGTFPPLAALEPWVARKLAIRARTTVGAMRRKTWLRRTLWESEVRSVTLKIARKIAYRGIKARWVLRDAAPKIIGAVTEEIGKALREAMA